MRVLRVDALRREARDRIRLDQKIDAFGAAAMPALDQHRARAEREQFLALLPHLGFVFGDRRLQQGGGFRQIRGDDQRLRHQHIAQDLDRFGREQPVAGRRDHHRIEHDLALVVTFEPRRHRFDHRRLRQHADLDRADIEIGKHRIDLRGDEVRRHVVDRGDALGILRGQRRDHRGAIDAERGEGFQIGLDAGAAAGIRARDGDRDRRGHAAPRFSRAASTRLRNVSAAAFGSFAMRKSRDYRDAVGAGRDRVRRIAFVDAGDRSDRKARRALADRGCDRAQAFGADRRIGIVFRHGLVDPADADIVEMIERRLFAPGAGS